MCRFDIIWNKNIILDEIDCNKFNISYWGNTDIDKNYTFDNVFIENTLYKGIHIIFFISNSINMDIFTNLYNKLDEYKNIDKIPIIWHLIERYHLEKIKLMDIINFIFIVAIDLEIESRVFSEDTPGYNNIGKKILNKEILY